MKKTLFSLSLLIAITPSVFGGGVHGKLPISDFEDTGNTSILPIIIVGIIGYLIFSFFANKKESK